MNFLNLFRSPLTGQAEWTKGERIFIEPHISNLKCAYHAKAKESEGLRERERAMNGGGGMMGVQMQPPHPGSAAAAGPTQQQSNSSASDMARQQLQGRKHS